MRGMFAVLSDVRPGASVEDFVDWYTSVHIPDVTSVDGVPSARLYESIEGPNPQFLATYDIEGDDLTQVMKGVRAHTPKLISEGRIIESFALHLARPFAFRHGSGAPG
jgi:hypothetical protein